MNFIAAAPEHRGPQGPRNSAASNLAASSISQSRARFVETAPTGFRGIGNQVSARHLIAQTLVASGGYCASYSSISQAAMPCEDKIRRGTNGLIVPAKTIRPLRSSVRAKFFASASVSKVVVRRGLRGRGRTPGLTSTVTYQVCDILDP